MNEIGFVPERIARLRHRNIILVKGVLIIILISIAFTVMFYFPLRDYERALQLKEAIDKKYSKLEMEINRARMENDKKRRAIGAVDLKRKKLGKAYKNIFKYIPPAIEVENININSRISLSGRSNEYNSIIKLMSSLEKSGEYNSVKLEKINLDNENRIYSFSINAAPLF